MKTSILNTEFNFAKSINLSLIAAPDAYPSYPSGMLDFIKPYLQKLQEYTIIPDYLTLVSIQTIDNQDAGVHILTFIINDPEACFGQAPLIKRITTVFMVTVPFTC